MVIQLSQLFCFLYQSANFYISRLTNNLNYNIVIQVVTYHGMIWSDFQLRVESNQATTLVLVLFLVLAQFEIC